MSGDWKRAKHAGRRPLDGGVRQLLFLREDHGQRASRNLDKVICGRKGLGTYVTRLRLPFAVLHCHLFVGQDGSMDRDSGAAIGAGRQDDPYDHRPLKIYAGQSLNGAGCLPVLVDRGQLPSCCPFGGRSGNEEFGGALCSYGRRSASRYRFDFK